jgi:hypothetical protein
LKTPRAGAFQSNPIEKKELDDVKSQGEQFNRNTGACGLGRWFQLEQSN